MDRTGCGLMKGSPSESAGSSLTTVMSGLVHFDFSFQIHSCAAILDGDGALNLDTSFCCRTLRGLICLAALHPQFMS